MRELFSRYRRFYQPIFALCSHGDSGTVRGVVSPARSQQSRIPSVRTGCVPAESIHQSQATDCVCGVPAYLVGLDEHFKDYALGNPIPSYARGNGMQDVHAQVISIAGTRSERLPDLRL